MKQLADRVVALGALDEGAHEAAIRALEMAGERAGAARLRQQLADLRNPVVRRASDEPQLIFVVDGGTISPLATLDHGELMSYSTGSGDQEAMADAARRFSERYFATRRAYHLYSRGAAEGLALVNRKEEPGCYSMMASFARVPKGASTLEGGIATNFDLKSGKPKPAPALTGEQRRQMVDLVRSVLQSEAVGEGPMNALLNAHDANGPAGLIIDVGPSGDSPFPVLIATASFESQSGQDEPELSYHGYELRMIAEADKSGRYRLTHKEFNHTEAVQEFSPRRFLTYMDIDQDGHDDLVFSGSGYEWWWYEALGRSADGWKLLVQGESSGC
ncbi:hypothetical protein ACQ859_20265 [Roseateles chitinivorans]|uniref:hypothetical protein n=1 Tax=Roseateles chitinivorans TaxID=2917965 RepID=UPI003D66E78F